MELIKHTENLTPKKILIGAIGVLSLIIILAIATGSDKENDDVIVIDDYKSPYQEEEEVFVFNEADDYSSDLEPYDESTESTNTASYTKTQQTTNSPKTNETLTNTNPSETPANSSAKTNSETTTKPTATASNQPQPKQKPKQPNSQQGAITKNNPSTNNPTTPTTSSNLNSTNPQTPNTAVTSYTQENTSPSTSTSQSTAKNQTPPDQQHPQTPSATAQNTQPKQSAIPSKPKPNQAPEIDLAFKRQTADTPIVTFDDDGNLIIPTPPSPRKQQPTQHKNDHTAQHTIDQAATPQNTPNKRPTKQNNLATPKNIELLNKKMLTSLVTFQSDQGAERRSRYKVSVLEMDIFCDTHGKARLQRPDQGDTAFTSYQDATSFLNWLTTEHRSSGLLEPSHTYRLPHPDEIKTNKVWTLNDPSKKLKSFGFIKAKAN